MDILAFLAYNLLVLFGYLSTFNRLKYMDFQNEKNFIVYTIKKNYLSIYSEFLEFQSLVTRPEEHSAKSQLDPQQTKLINQRNFKALYWIVLYLKDIKGNSLQLIYDFFLYKNWTTWQFKNFSYHYYKIIQSDKVKNEIQQLENFINREENYCYATQPHDQSIPESSPKEKPNKPHKPIIVGDYLNNHNTAIHINSSLEESLKRLEQTKKKVQNN